MGNFSSMQNIDVSDVMTQKSIKDDREMNKKMMEFDSYIDKLASEIYKRIKQCKFQKINSSRLNIEFPCCSLIKNYPDLSDISHILRSHNYDVVSVKTNGGYTDVNAYTLRKLNNIFAEKMEIQNINLQYTEFDLNFGWYVNATIKILSDENNN